MEMMVILIPVTYIEYGEAGRISVYDQDVDNDGVIDLEDHYSYYPSGYPEVLPRV